MATAQPVSGQKPATSTPHKPAAETKSAEDTAKTTPVFKDFASI